MARSADQRLFIIFANQDREWVFGFLLPALGLPEKDILTPEKFRPGAPIAVEFANAVKNSRYTLVVLTPAFVADQWSQFGEQLASYASVAGERERLIPLVLETTEIPLTVEFRVRLDFTSTEQWETEAARLRSLLEQPEPDQEDIPCPYPGLKAYTKKEASRFFGREKAVNDLLNRLRLSPFLVVVGPSGSGKSSLVQAGLIPRLPGCEYFTPKRWKELVVRAGSQPFENLAQELCKYIQQSKETILKALAQEPGSLSRLLAEITQPSPAPSNVLVFLDQFEAIFAQCKDFQLRNRFLEQLCATITSSPEHVYLILAMRADFFGELQNSALWGCVESNLFNLPSLNSEELRQAIVQPASQTGVYLEPALVERLLGDAGEAEKGVLSLLQEALQILWAQHRQRRLLTLSGYLSMGREGKSGLQVAISDRADAVIGKLTEKQKRDVARRILIRLVEYGEHIRTRRQQDVEQLRAATDGEAIFNEVLEYLAQQRLLTIDRDTETNSITVDLIHEMLIESWDTLAGWVESFQVVEEERRSLWLAATSWLENGREPSYLFHGSRLRKEQAWAAQWGQELGNRELDFLQASCRRRNLQWGLIASVILALVVALAVWIGAREYTRRMIGSPLVAIRAGISRIGSDVSYAQSLEQPKRQIELLAFKIEKYEVSNRQYQACISAGSCEAPLVPIEANKPDYPVVWVSFVQAQDFCKWVGRRLPTAVEWERAARGQEGRAWPWGNEPVPFEGFEFPEGPVPVDLGDETATLGPEQILHMLDNVKEWVVRSGQDCSGIECHQGWDGKSEQAAYMGGAYDSNIDRLSEIQPSSLYAPDPSTGFRCMEGPLENP